VDFDDIVDGMHTARSRGYEPTQVHLGAEDAHDLMADANFTRATAGVQASSRSMGQVAGLDVQTAPVSHMRIMTAQCDEHVEFYIF